MQPQTRLLHIADEKTQPLPLTGSLSFQLYLNRYALSIRDVALTAGVRLLVVWNILQGNPVAPEDAGKVRAALFTLTRERYRGSIPVRPLAPYPLADARQGLTRHLAHV